MNVSVTEEEHRFLLDVINIYHGGDIERLLLRAVQIPGGRSIRGSDDELLNLLDAIGIEVTGFLRVESESKPRRKRAKPGGTADRLQKLYDSIEGQLS